MLRGEIYNALGTVLDLLRLSILDQSQTAAGIDEVMCPFCFGAQKRHAWPWPESSAIHMRFICSQLPVNGSWI